MKPTTKQKRKPGRPRLDFSPALKARICREVALGKSLRRTLKMKGMPSMAKVMETLQEDSKFAEQYARARERGIGLHIDGILDLADKATGENAHAIRLRVDTRKWLASKLVPKVYGDRVDVGLAPRPAIEPDGVVGIDAARRIMFVLGVGERELEAGGFKNLAKLWKLEQLLRERGIGLPAPKGWVGPWPPPRPTPPRLPAPQEEPKPVERDVTPAPEGDGERAD